MFKFHSKLMCMSKLVEVSDNRNKTLVDCRICPFTIHYESIMFYSTEYLHFLYRPKKYPTIDKHASLFFSAVSNEEMSSIGLTPGCRSRSGSGSRLCRP